MLPDDMDLSGMPLLVADNEPAYAQDLSTPKTAAQAVADLELRATLHGSRKARDFFREALKGYRTYFLPSVVQRLEKNLAEVEQEGRKRFQDERPTVKSVEEHGDAAHVFLSGTQGGEPRYVLRRVGARWLVDARQVGCGSCDKAGTCGRCRGSGTFDGEACFSCNGMKKCLSCNGVGWIEP